MPMFTEVSYRSLSEVYPVGFHFTRTYKLKATGNSYEDSQRAYRLASALRKRFGYSFMLMSQSRPKVG
jgi:hypothetical protein